jgi:hypothetical protein
MLIAKLVNNCNGKLLIIEFVEKRGLNALQYRLLKDNFTTVNFSYTLFLFVSTTNFVIICYQLIIIKEETFTAIT